MSCEGVEIKNVSVTYGDKPALEGINLSITEGSIYAFIGPSGCGKTTLLRSINRLNDYVSGFSLTGDIFIRGKSIYTIKEQRELRELRIGIGMIFQKPNPLPMTIMKNMLLPYTEHMFCSTEEARKLAVEKLELVGLYSELTGKLDKPASSLSGGQQQRLCIARALMLPSTLMLLDEPCSALDPVSTYKIEELLLEIKKDHTIIMVTHNMEQALRIADYTAFFYQGKIIEAGETMQIFSYPKEELTQKYVTRRTSY